MPLLFKKNFTIIATVFVYINNDIRDNTMVKIMTFNIRYGTADDGMNSWYNRKHLVIDRIKSFDPDLLGLQECRDDEQAEYIKEKLPDYEFIGVRRGSDDSNDSLEMSPLLFKKSVFTAIAKNFFWLSDTPHIPASVYQGSAFPRPVTWVALQANDNKKKVVTFFNTHFDYQSFTVQIKSAELLRTRIEALGPAMPAIITGDFNANRGSEPFRKLVDLDSINPLVEAYWQLHPHDREGTFHEYGSLSMPTSIDWVLFSSKHFFPRLAKIDTTSQGYIYPSDHYPICVELDWR